VTLLEVLQSLIERTYRMVTGISELDRFVVGDRGMRRVTADRSVVSVVGSRSFADAKVLVRQTDEGLHANIYYPDVLIAALENRNPLYGLDADNLDAFAVFVEELDHLLTMADRARVGRQFSLFELELHANVTKYVACKHFLAKSCGRSLTPDERAWLRWSLFEKLTPFGSEALRARYEDADRLAARLACRLDSLPPPRRLDALRRFHRLPVRQTVRWAEGRHRTEVT